MDLDLDQAQVEALEARTEGWVAGLQLAARHAMPANNLLLVWTHAAHQP